MRDKVDNIKKMGHKGKPRISIKYRRRTKVVGNNLKTFMNNVNKYKDKKGLGIETKETIYNKSKTGKK